MQLVAVVGETQHNFGLLFDWFDRCGKTTKTYSNDFAKLSAYWNDAQSQERTIRESPCFNLHSVSMLILTTKNRMLKVLSCNINKLTFDTQDQDVVGCLVHGTLDEWRDVVIRLLAFKDTNLLGQCILAELDKLGYSGLFCDYTRKKEGEQLLLK